MSASIIQALRAAGCVFAEDEARVLVEAANDATELEAMVGRRVAGEPLEYIVGWAEFYGHRVIVQPGVFVPRRRTELMVTEAIALLHPHATVLDVGCGSGAVALAVRSTVDVNVWAVDIDDAAVACARLNLGPIVRQGDLYEPLPPELRGSLDLILANAPYVPADAIRLMPPEARDHEHRVALDGGADGLDVVRRVIADAPSWLRPGGHLLIETSQRQAPAVLDAMRDHALIPRLAEDDEIGATVAIGARGAV